MVKKKTRDNAKQHGTLNEEKILNDTEKIRKIKSKNFVN